MDVVTWNINSLRMRLGRLKAWLEQHQPQVVCLQETKCPDDQFPREPLEELGYHVAYVGEKGLNGVAILSREPLDEVETVLPGREDDTQRRYIAARVGNLRVINVYVPNGKSVASDAFFYKLDWLSRLQGHLRQNYAPTEDVVLVGDFNVAPSDLDVHDPIAWKDRLHCTQHERRAIGYLAQWGFQDALRLRHPEDRLYSWFDYRTADAVQRGEGLRIDLVLITAPLVDRLLEVSIDLEERQRVHPGEKPSDHAPVVARLT